MAEQHSQDEALDEEAFDMAGTRPELLLGLPYSLAGSLMLVGLAFLMLYTPESQVRALIGDAIALGAIGMVWSTARFLLQSDYHGWDNFLAYMRLDFRCLDTREWGGARVASLPLRSAYRSGAADV